MKFSVSVRIYLVLILLFSQVSAFETDQYNLPPEPLADIGDEVAEYVEDNVRMAFEKLNAEISASQKCLENQDKNCRSAADEKSRLDYLRSEQAIAKEVYKNLGAGFIPSTKSGTWMNSHHFKATPARYKTSFGDSIYRNVPTSYFSISPTVKIYGIQFGTDKIAHIFQQGYDYYKRFDRTKRLDLSDEKANEKAFAFGRFTERTYFGILVSGVYSNGDLAANFAGMKFYQGLTHEIKIGAEMRPPTLVLQNGFWEFNKAVSHRENLLKPFISEHFNEALNPSKYIFGLRSFIRGVVRRKSCAAWRVQYPNRSAEDFQNITRELKLWHGEDYGFADSDKFVTIGETCFDKS